MQSFEPGLAGLIPELRWRGLFHAASEGLEARLAAGRPIAGYNGFDPSGPWLHIGHLIPIFGLLHLQRHGGRPIVVVGGGTGMIGDPSGKSTERNLMARPEIEANVEVMRAQFERLLDFSGAGAAQLVDNHDWLAPFHLLDWLRDVGKHFTVPYMLAKDSVQLRLERGLSFTEFSYMLIQATDFSHLHRTLGVELQMGGADQWGNITAGLELIRREAGGAPHPGAPGAYALAYPLLLSPSGAKFGKTEAGESVWLHPDGTSPYAFFQHWLNTDDRDVPVYLRWFTTMNPGQIESLEAELADHAERRAAQRALAEDVTARVHGRETATAVIRASELLFEPGPIRDPATLEHIHRVVGGFVAAPELVAAGVLAVLAETGLAPSRGEARRLVHGGAVTINGEAVRDAGAPMPEPIDGRWFEVRIGKRRREVGRLQT
ncbi:MAG TPA: tyrosine--tRNA ligase [Candidatus Binatus sp.]|nr:tyrosine--tRNA ligase [Candidatus Binatus sp.]